MPPRILQFEFIQYLILNIIGHDVIHDYGNADSDRWKGVQQVLQSFYNRSVVGGTNSITNSITKSITEPTSQKSSLILHISREKSELTSTMRQTKDKLDDYNIIPCLERFIDDIENEIIMYFFHIYLISMKYQENKKNNIETGNNIEKITVADYIDSIKNIPVMFLVPNSKDIIQIYSDISDLFCMYFESINSIKNRRNSTDSRRSRNTNYINKRFRKINTIDMQINKISELDFLMKELHKFFKNEEYKSYIKTVLYSYTIITITNTGKRKTDIFLQQTTSDNVNNDNKKRRKVFLKNSRKIMRTGSDPEKKRETYSNRDKSNISRKIMRTGSDHEKKRKTYSNRSKHISGKSLYHGGIMKEKLSENDSIQLTENIKIYIETPEFKNEKQIMIDSYKRMITIDNNMSNSVEENKEELRNGLNFMNSELNKNRIIYNEMRMTMITNLTEKYKLYNADKYARTLHQMRIISEKIPKNFDVESDISKVIDSSLKTPEKIAKQKREKDEAKMKQIADDILALESGKLTTEDKTLVSKFMRLIARMGLILTNTVTRSKNNNNEWDHKLNPIAGTPDPTLEMEIHSLLKIANFQNIESLIKNKDIDTVLINHYIDKYEYKTGEQLEENLNCRSDKKYIINNAAPVGSLKKYAFCPYTSIIDGMSACSWKTAKIDGIEYGDMDFKITDSLNNESSLYYNGFLNIIPNDNNYDGNYPTIVDVGFNVNFPRFGRVEGKKQVNMKNVDVLDAAVVLRNTLLTILLSIPNLNYDNVWGDIYNRLEEYINDPLDATNTKQIKIYALIYREILFKGVGDLFQEINAVAKHGGYTTYFCDQDIYEYPKNGNEIRCFLANDRPSGTRFIYMLLNGKPEQINTKAFGGYYGVSGEKDVLVKHSSNKKICSRQ